MKSMTYSIILVVASILAALAILQALNACFPLEKVCASEIELLDKTKKVVVDSIKPCRIYYTHCIPGRTYQFHCPKIYKVGDTITLTDQIKKNIIILK